MWKPKTIAIVAGIALFGFLGIVTDNPAPQTTTSQATPQVTPQAQSNREANSEASFSPAS
jgi:hypothetical protein